MIKNILIIEDLPSDIKYYEPIFMPGREVSVLLVNRDENYTEENLSDDVELLYGSLSSKVKHYFTKTREEINGFLMNKSFDFYVIDSLGGFAEQLIAEAGLPKEKIAFLSSTKSFRESVQAKGYRAYKKESADELSRDCFPA